jgi:hypothetical protein
MLDAKKIKSILKVLRDELTLQTRHMRLLEAQQLALLACDRVRFTAYQDEYAQVLVKLEAQDTARRAALTDENDEPILLSVLKTQVSDRNQSVLQTLEEELRRTLDQVQSLTRRNQTLIQNELDYLAFSLDLFVEAGRSADNGYGIHCGSVGQRGGRLSGLLLLDRRA